MLGIISLISNGLKALGLLLGLIKREEEKKEDFQIAHGADVDAVVKEQQGAQVIAEGVHKLSDADLDKRLRDAGAGR